MRGRLSPLLCELHAHTSWSDGMLGLPQLVDLYGASGFDVLCVTDHVVRRDSSWLEARSSGPLHVHAGNYAAYAREIAEERERARVLYDMVLLPGLELTYDDDDPRQAAHAVAVGLDRFVDVDNGLERALIEARDAGAALIAAHPYSVEAAAVSYRGTGRFAADWRELALLVDRFELVNRHELFQWVADERLPAVASGDFHTPEHLVTWKTLIPCEKAAKAVVAYLRSPRPTYLVQPHAHGMRLRPAA